VIGYGTLSVTLCHRGDKWIMSLETIWLWRWPSLVVESVDTLCCVVILNFVMDMCNNFDSIAR